MRIKQNATEALANYFGAAMPELHTHALQQPPQGISQYPALAVLPESFRLQLHSSNADLFDGNADPVTDENATYLQVGYLAGNLQLWLAARYPSQRSELEGAIVQEFCGTDAPGRILIDVDTSLVSSAVTYAQPVAYLLEDEQWREELAFSERRWSILQVSVDLPLRVAFRDAPVVREYIVDLAGDLGDAGEAQTVIDSLTIHAGNSNNA